MAFRPALIDSSAAPVRPGFGAAALEIIARLDYVLLAAVAALVGFGLWMISTITRDDVRGDPTFFLSRQGVAAALGVVAMVVLTAVHPNVLRRLRVPFYLATVVSLIVVLLTPAVRGTHRWIDLGYFNLQPSEFAKITLAVVLAAFVAERAAAGVGFRTIVGAMTIAAPPVVLVFVEPDFGTAVLLIVGVVAVLFFGGAHWRTLGSFALAAIFVALSLLWILPANDVDVLKPYQVDRLSGFLDPSSDPSGTTYNINQSITAVGSGGLTGRGSEGATQTSSFFLPEHATDFVFSSIAEQRGFVGALALLLLYGVVIWRGIRIISIAPSLFSALLAGALVAVLVFQIAINVGMTMGIAPVVGIPLPFVSYGGSSMVVSLAMMGVLMAVHVRGRMTSR